MKEKIPFRARNPETTRADILNAARAEFATSGLGGARVDKIAEKSGANKRMIYHYFGSKEELFTAVIEDAYASIRVSEMKLQLGSLAPDEAIKKLVEFTWNYYVKNPEFITLVTSENLHKAKHVAGNQNLKKLQQAYVENVAEILQRGVVSGVFRPGIDASQLCITIAAVGFYYLNNRHTSSALFGFNFTSEAALKARLDFNIETIMRMILAKP
jgi:AcrR family transcriptional regulator